MPVGTEIAVRWVGPGSVARSATAKDVSNWDYFDGAIVGVGVTDGATFTISGSGVLAAPGLVITATHVLRDHTDALEAGAVAAYCIGVRSDGRADLWNMRSLSYP